MRLTRITARFAGRCAASGTHFPAGAYVMHDAESKRCYLPEHAPKDAEVRETPLPGSQQEAFGLGWKAGAPDAPPTTCPYPEGSPEAACWRYGLRERHAKGA